MRTNLSVSAHDMAIAMRDDPEWAAEVIILLSPATCRRIRESHQAKLHTYDGKIEALKKERE